VRTRLGLQYGLDFEILPYAFVAVITILASLVVGIIDHRPAHTRLDAVRGVGITARAP
jgi:hypothetical protein